MKKNKINKTLIKNKKNKATVNKTVIKETAANKKTVNNTTANEAAVDETNDSKIKDNKAAENKIRESRTVPEGRKRFSFKYKLLCCFILCLIYAAGCSFTWNAVTISVFAYSGQTLDGYDGVNGAVLPDFQNGRENAGSDNFIDIYGEDLLDEDEMEAYGHGEGGSVSDNDRISVDDILAGNTISENDLEDSEGETELSKDDWRLVLINKQYSIPEDYTFTFGTINTMKGPMKCDERIIPDLLKMLKAAKDDGINLEICSPYRDLNYQNYLFDRKIKVYMKQGMSYLEAYATASKTVTVPGASEHQIGLALDIVCDTYIDLDEGFGETAAGKWLAEHGCEYGFILRYPEGKEYVTGIEYEPWHFRYVGAEAATIIMGEELTLEEFVASLEDWR